MEREEEWRKLVSCVSDYDELLRRGSVHARSDDPDEWRRSIREKARADRIKVRTSASDKHSGVVFAYLKHLDERREQTSAERAGLRRQLEAFDEGRSRARLKGHRVERVLRAEHGQPAAVCSTCGARLYIDWRTEPAFMEGEVFDDDCPAS